MKQLRYIWIIACMVLMVPYSAVRAQLLPDSVPMVIDFEEDTWPLDQGKWELNPGTPNAEDKWVVGNSTAALGHRSLYISHNGKFAEFGAHPNVVVATRTIKFPTENYRREYDITFDWKNSGNAANSGLLHVWLVAKNGYLQNPVTTSETKGVLSTKVLENFQLKNLQGKHDWQSASITNFGVSKNFSTQEFVLVFVWQNLNDDSTKINVGACIDNIQISSNQIRKPEYVNVDVECPDSSLVISWNLGSCKRFDVEYKMAAEIRWHRMTGLQLDQDVEQGIGTCSYKISGLKEGSWDVRVRNVNDTIKSAWTYSRGNILYCPENHCINYTAINDPGQVICARGAYVTNSYTYIPDSAHVGTVDYGWDDPRSRHTVIWDPTLKDERTGERLKMVPDGEMAAVRLHTWNPTGRYFSSMEYKLHVDAGSQQILLLKYALVQTYSKSHSSKEKTQARFFLEIRDEHGHVIPGANGGSCGQAQFAAGENKFGEEDLAAWNWDGKDDGRKPEPETNDVVWKDWSTVGLDLTQYAGQDVTVYIESSGCSQSAHYGYVYFTLDCASAKLSTDNCGANASITAEAPEGFNYLWTNEAGDTISTERTLTASSGSREIFSCKITFAEDTSCYFYQSTLLAPRYPVPSYKPEFVASKCDNRVRLRNTSHVMNKWEGGETHTNEPCEESSWEFNFLTGDKMHIEQSVYTPVLSCRPIGDTIQVIHTTYLSDGECDSTLIDTLIVPSVLSEPIFVDTAFCEGGAVKFEGKYYTDQGDYPVHLSNWAGCDSLRTLRLTVHRRSPEGYDTVRICSRDLPYVRDGKKFYTTDHRASVWNTNVNGCDSILNLDITVVEHLETEVEEIPILCAKDTVLLLEYSVDAGFFDSVRVTFSDQAIAAGFRDTFIVGQPVGNVIEIPYQLSTLPGNYTLIVEYYQETCGSQVFRLPVDLRYSPTILKQKWNDVVAVVNDQFNGGYTFSAYQWYLDDERIPGATGSYYYLEGDTMSVGQEYCVELTRTKDGVTQFSCPITITYHRQQSLFPTIMSAGARVRAYMPKPAVLTYYSVDGHLLGSTRIVAGTSTTTVPAVAGVAIMTIAYDDNTTETKKLILQ